MPETSTVVFFTGIAAVVVVARFLLSRQGTTNRGRSSGQQRVVTESMVTIVQTILPQWDRDSIRNDLNETHSIEETTTRLLSRPPPVRAAPPVATSAQTSSFKPSDGSLLQRYGLNGDEKAPEVSSGYQSEREAREKQLKLQRQAMVINARKRVLEMEASKQKQ